MKVLIDTNIILDVLCKRKDFVFNSELIFKYCELKSIDGYISALSIPNIIYIMRKELDSKKITEIINILTAIFKIIELNESDIKKALSLDMPDYEDALQSIQATRIKANYIITRNVKDYKNSEIKSLTPEEFLKIYNII